MYVPAAFRDDSLPSLHEFLRAYSFATLVSRLEGELFATHVPLLLNTERGPMGSLMGHMARANPHWHAFENASESEETLAIFHGPHAYISPRWYVARTAVPTWNYAAVHAYCRPRLLETDAELLEVLTRTARYFEGEVEERWDPAAQPDGFLDSLLPGIVGFELQIARLEGKRKLSQNRSEADRRSVVDALSSSLSPHDQEVAALMRERLEAS